jgi:hypothetical protein
MPKNGLLDMIARNDVVNNRMQGLLS